MVIPMNERAKRYLELLSKEPVGTYFVSNHNVARKQIDGWFNATNEGTTPGIVDSNVVARVMDVLDNFEDEWWALM